MASLTVAGVFIFFLLVVITSGVFRTGSAIVSISDKIGILEVEGPIADSTLLLAQIKEFREQDNIKAHITTHNPQVQDILDRNIPKLREILEQQGMNLEQIQVTVAADDGGSGQLFQEQFEQNRFNRNLRRNAHQMDFAMPEEEMDISVQNPDEQSLSVHA